MLKLGLLGSNIAYSKSPTIHNYWLKQYDIPGNYQLYDIDVANLAEFLTALSQMSLTGLNVTIPYKQKVFSFIKNKSANAINAQAINTIACKNKSLFGDNTDVKGCLDIFNNLKARVKIATLFGNGGAARAVVTALQQVDSIEIRIICRQQPTAPLSNVAYYGWQDQAAAICGADLLINCTPLGLNGQGNPLNVNIQSQTICIDVVYTPRLTPFLQTGLQAGAKIIDGLELLIRQAQHSFFLWTNVFPDINADLRKKLQIMG